MHDETHKILDYRQRFGIHTIGIIVIDSLRDSGLEDSLAAYPCLDPRRRAGGGELLLSLESPAPIGTLRMDQPLSAFAERRFGSRYVMSRAVPCPEPLSLGEEDVSAQAAS